MIVIEDGVEDLVVEDDWVVGVIGEFGDIYLVDVVVIMIGIFLKGIIYCGVECILVGCVGEKLVIGLLDCFYVLDFFMGWLKMGILVWLNGEIIDWDCLEK